MRPRTFSLGQDIHQSLRTWNSFHFPSLLFVRPRSSPTPSSFDIHQQITNYWVQGEFNPSTEWCSRDVGLGGRALWYQYWGAADGLASLADDGIDIIVSNLDYLYFDFPYEVNSEERGYYWGARFNSVYNVFSFAPENLPHILQKRQQTKMAMRCLLWL